MGRELDEEEMMRQLRENGVISSRSRRKVYPQGERFIVNKRTHRIRFDKETEDSVIIVVEPKAADEK